MDGSPAAGSRSDLTSADAGRLQKLIADVMATDPPVVGLLNVLADMEREQNPALAVAVFEGTAWRSDMHHYWVWFRISRAYVALGPARQDAAFLTCTLAVQMQPDWPSSTQPFRDLFQILHQRGRAREAIDLFRLQMDLHPAQPAAEPHEIAELLAREGVSLSDEDMPAPQPRDRSDHRVVESDRPAAWTCEVYGGAMPYALRGMGDPGWRSPIDVAELPDAELLICHNATVVFDRGGALHTDLSVSAFPELVRRRVRRLEQAGEVLEQYEADEAVVILDRFPHSNLCHFLLDQVSRLALYRRAGIDITRALVVSPPFDSAFQRHILRASGVSRALGTDRVARVRVARLWVSTNCRELEHCGHQGSAWVVDYAREILGGRGTHGWRRLYLSRADAVVRQVVNEAEVVALLEAHGFEVLVPGRMPYAAQVTAFRQASHVISAHGAALAHVVLLPPGAHVLEMFNPLYGTAAYAMQAAPCGIHYAAMTARDGHSDAPEWNDPRLADVSRSQHGPRSLRVDLDVLRAYLADHVADAA